MFAIGYKCFKCGRRYPISIRFKCDCGRSLDIEYDYGKIRKSITKDFFEQVPSHWKYWMFYPVKKLVSMNEGGTPLLESVKIGESLGCRLFLKCETVNPTGSFKDRGSTIEISRAVELGVKKLSCATTGNMGASVAAYCARAGIKASIYVPYNTPPFKIKHIKAYGARVISVNGTYEKAAKLSEKTGMYLAGDYPYRGEGEKSVGFEIADCFSGNLDYIVCPVGNGTLIYAVWKAFRELKICGLIKRVPKLVGVQAKGCNPVVRAFRNGWDDVKPVKKPRTIADAIACENPIDGLEALEAIRDSRGFAVDVTDKEILRAVKALAAEGVYAEPGGAAATAGLMKFRDEFEGKTVVSLVTGTGMKSNY